MLLGAEAVKSTEAKYLLLLDRLAADPCSTQQALAGALDVPCSLVNRYLGRLADWGAIRVTGGAKKKYTLTPKGATLLRQASWMFLASHAAPLERLRLAAVAAVRSAAEARGLRGSRDGGGRAVRRGAHGARCAQAG